MQAEETVQFGGQGRLRGEFKDPIDYRIPGLFGRPASEDAGMSDEWAIIRLRPHVRFNFIEEFSAFIQPQASFAIAGEASATPSQDELDFHQAYFDVKFKPWSLRVGRQELQFGDQRLIGPLDWSHIGRAWDGLRVGYAAEEWKIDAWATDINEGVDARADRQFYGAYVSCTAVESHTFDVALLRREFGHDFFLSEGGRPGDLDEWSAAARASGKTGAWDYSGELVFQWGSLARDPIRAWGLAFNGGHTFEEDWKPRVGLEYTLATGDENPADGRRERFLPLFTFAHAYQGYMDLFQWSNNHDLALKLSAVPGAEWKVGFDAHGFWLDEAKDGWTNAGGTIQRRDRTGNSGTFLGAEIDVHARWKPEEAVDLWFGVSGFCPGDFVDATGPDPAGFWGFLQLTVSF